MKVVVADNDHDIADTLVEMLCVMGYHAVAAYDGREAVQTCIASEFELVILDVQMPLLDGCAAALLIREGPHPPRMIAAHSALEQHEEPMKSHGTVFDVRLAKPVRMNELSELLATVVSRAPLATG